MNKIKAIGTYKIAGICQVTPATVGRWVNEGKLPCFTTGGGHRRVWVEDLAKFLKDHNMPIPNNLVAGATTRILIVDDNPLIRRLALRILRKNFPNVEIYEAKDGFEAGHKTASLMPSLVILDLKLPGVDGLEVCRSIRKDPNLMRTKVLTVSGYDMQEAKKRSLKAGADDFLGKPFDSKALIEKVRHLVPSLKL